MSTHHGLPDTHPRSARTTLTVGLVLLVTIPFVISASDLWRLAFGAGLDSQTTHRLIAYEWDPREAGFFLQLAAVMMAALCGWTLVVAIGLWARVETFRMAGLLTFAGLGLISIMLAFGGAFAEQRPEGWLLAVVVALVNTTIVGLLWSVEVADDISRGAHARKRRRRLARQARNGSQ
ncbi:MAG TPA: hypothetical protein VGA69_02380 [Nitriliruptorales bacterium]